LSSVTLRPYGSMFFRWKGEVFAIRGNQAIGLSWTDDNHLVVSCPCGSADIEARHTQWRDVSVSFLLQGAPQR
jgi:hypothetical protein